MAYNNSTNGTAGYSVNFVNLKIAYYTVDATIISVGISVNLWVLVAMLTSQDMRSSMRNKQVCVMLLSNTLRSGVISLLEIIEISLFIESRVRLHCGYGTFVKLMRFTLMWVENWCALIFFVHYICTQLEFNPVKYLSPRKLQIGTIAILAGPWIFSFIVGPAVFVGYSHHNYGVFKKGCIYWTFDAYDALGKFGIVTPYFIKYALISLILLLHYKRKTRYTSMNSSLIGPNTHIDDVKPYVVLFVVIAITQSLLVARLIFDMWTNDILFNLIYYVTSWFLSEARTIFMLPAFLTFTDIWTRLKTWRPWYRPGSGIDLTVQYSQSKDDNIN